jgi:flagellar basal-body rod protein FlgC
MNLIRTMGVAAGGMSAQRRRLGVIAENLANANTTRTEDGTPYRRRTAILQTVPGGGGFETHLENAMEHNIHGVEVVEVVPVKGPFNRIFDPSHPDAGEDGHVHLPNVNPVQEMVFMLNANRAYESNAAVVKAAKDMALKSLEIGR